MSFLGRVALAIGLVALALAAWQVRQVALLLFGGLIFAVVLDAVVDLIQRLSRGGRKPALLAAVLLVALVVGGLLWLIGDKVAAQLDAVRDSLPAAVSSLREWLQQMPLGRRLLEVIDEAGSDDLRWSWLADAARMTLTALAHLVLMLMIGVFLAAEPRLYVDGLARLVPVSVRPQLRNALEACGTALGGWLKGQGISMLFVGVATGVGLALLGVPMAFTLGLIAGLMDFVPFFGPIASGLLAVVFAFTVSPETALYVAILMLVIQQVEGNLMLPLVQRWAVRLPPVLGVVSVVVFASLFGLLGALFATPLTVVLMVLVRKLYVEDFLESAPPAKR